MPIPIAVWAVVGIAARIAARQGAKHLAKKAAQQTARKKAQQQATKKAAQQAAKKKPCFKCKEWKEKLKKCNKEKGQKGGVGGRHGTISPGNNKRGMESNHVPPASVWRDAGYDDFPFGSMGAVNMEKDHHRNIPSTGSSNRSKAFRAKQVQKLIKGDIEGALQMEIDEMMKKGNYEKGVKALKEYYRCLGLIK